MKSLVFFNNKGGVGKTSLVYHLAWMYADLGLRVVAVDLDPQANLTAMFLPEERLEELWPDGDHPDTILGAVKPILSGAGDIAEPHVESIAERIGLVVGDLGLSRFETKLSASWSACLDRDEAAFRVVSSFFRIIQSAAARRRADISLIDVGSNLGAINRSALLAANFVAVPLASDLFSLQGLENLGPNLREWRSQWLDRLNRRPADPRLALPPAKWNRSGTSCFNMPFGSTGPSKHTNVGWTGFRAPMPPKFLASRPQHRLRWPKIPIAWPRSRTIEA